MASRSLVAMFAGLLRGVEMVTPVHVASGICSLGVWGRLELTGARSALIRAAMGEDFNVPPEVAGELSHGVLILSEDLGRLLILPYAGDDIACLDLTEGGLAYPLVHLGRSAEPGLRTASVQILAGRGVLFLTEGGVCLFDQALMLSWLRAGDFLGWMIEGVSGDEALLVASDWTGRESRQVVSLNDGRSVP